MRNYFAISVLFLTIGSALAADTKSPVGEWCIVYSDDQLWAELAAQSPVSSAKVSAAERKVLIDFARRLNNCQTWVIKADNSFVMRSLLSKTMLDEVKTVFAKFDQTPTVKQMAEHFSGMKPDEAVVSFKGSWKQNGNSVIFSVEQEDKSIAPISAELKDDGFVTSDGLKLTRR